MWCPFCNWKVKFHLRRRTNEGFRHFIAFEQKWTTVHHAQFSNTDSKCVLGVHFRCHGFNLFVLQWMLRTSGNQNLLISSRYHDLFFTKVPTHTKQWKVTSAMEYDFLHVRLKWNKNGAFFAPIICISIDEVTRLMMIIVIIWELAYYIWAVIEDDVVKIYTCTVLKIFQVTSS